MNSQTYIPTIYSESNLKLINIYMCTLFPRYEQSYYLIVVVLFDNCYRYGGLNEKIPITCKFYNYYTTISATPPSEIKYLYNYLRRYLNLANANNFITLRLQI